MAGENNKISTSNPSENQYVNQNQATITPENKAAQIVVDQNQQLINQISKQQQQIDMQNTLFQSMLDKYQQTPEVASTLQNFPDYQRGVQIGSIGTKTLGNTPIFSAGAGLIPFSIYDERANAEAKAKEKILQEYEKSLDDKYSTIVDGVRNNAWLDTQASAFNEIRQKYIDRYGVIKGTVMAQQSPEYKLLVLKNGQISNNFNSYYKDVQKILADASSGKYVPENTLREARDFMNRTTGIDANYETIMKLKPETLSSYISLDSATTKAAEALNNYIKEDLGKLKYGTDINDYFEITKTKGINIKDAKSAKLVDDYAKYILTTSYGNVPNEQKPSLDDIKSSLKQNLYNQVTKDVKVLSKSDPISIDRYNREKESRKVSWDDLGARTIEYQDVNGNKVSFVSPQTKGYTPALDNMSSFSGAALGIPNSGQRRFKISFIGDTFNPSTKMYERIALANEVKKETVEDEVTGIKKTVEVPVGTPFKIDSNTSIQLFNQDKYITSDIPKTTRVIQKQHYTRTESPTQVGVVISSEKTPEMAFGLPIQYNNNKAYIAGDGKAIVNGRILKKGEIAYLKQN